MKEALDTAYRAQIVKLYQVLSDSILAASGDSAKIDAAEQRFKKGVAHAADVKRRAFKLVGIE